MSYREREQDEGPDSACEPCGVCGVEQADHGHVFAGPRYSFTHTYCDVCGELPSHPDHTLHDWEPASDNSPDEPDED